MDFTQEQKQKLNNLSIDPKGVKPCDRENCFHYGEGCGLGYRMEAFGFPGEDVFLNLMESKNIHPDLQLISSEKFKAFWREKLRGRVSQVFLPCSHQGCSDFFKCIHLDDPTMLSEWMKEQI